MLGKLLRRCRRLAPILIGLSLFAAHGLALAAPWRLQLHLNPAALQAWGIEIDVADGQGEVARYAGYRSLVVEADADSTGAGARFPLTLRLSGGGRPLRLQQLQVRILREREAILLSASDGAALLLGEMPHRHAAADRLDWRIMNLGVLPALAQRLRRPALVDQVIGGVDLEAPGLASDKGARNCRGDIRWPTAGFSADVALIDISGVFALRCQGCSRGSSSGLVVVAPNAELANVGAADIPWQPKFSPPAEPYGTDQHPYLVWSLYRIDGDGRLRQLTVSGLKHAFFAQNSQCDCNGDTILYRGCADLYSAFTNDLNSILGPRQEIAPRSALWGRCGSIYDFNCDGVQDANAGVSGGYAERAVVGEAELLAALQPAAEYWIEAWYVVRDDTALDNNLAHRRVTPTKSDTAWTFPASGGTQSGPLIERWASQALAGNQQRSRRAELPGGRLQLAVRVTAEGDRYRYDYALMNLDYSDSRLEGSAPNLRLVRNVGLLGLNFALPATAVSGLEWQDADSDPGTDWRLPLDAAQLQLRAGNDAGLTWGRLGSLRFYSARPAQPGVVAVILGDGTQAMIDSLVPTSPEHVFADGFEAF